MKNKLFILTLLLALTHNVNAKILKVNLVANNWCPQHCINDENSPGYLVEIAQSALDITKTQHTLTFQPWLRAVKNVNNGNFDGLLTPAQSEEKQLLRHNVALATQRFCFYVKKSNNISLNKLEDFNSKSIAFVKGNHLGNEFMNYIDDKNNKVFVNKLLSNNNEFAPRVFSFLIKKRVDAIAITEDMGDFYLGQNPDINQRIKKGYCTQKESLHVGLNPTNIKRSEEISEILDRGILKIKENGTYDKILKKYFLKK